VQLEVAETATLVAFVAAGIGVSLVPAAVANLAINGAVYRPLADTDITVELALAWRRDDTSAVVTRALDQIREHMAAPNHRYGGAGRAVSSVGRAGGLVESAPGRAGRETPSD
jgi:DNA-binding transcriptional LysR family regulator